jgi:hypothetical protein
VYPSLSTSLSIRLSVHVSVYPSLSTSLSIRLSVHLSVYPFNVCYDYQIIFAVHVSLAPHLTLRLL